MKKLLFYASMVLLGASSLMMGMLSGPEALMLMTSSIILGFVTLIVLVFMDHFYIWYVPCYVFVIITHGMYVFSGTAIAMTMIYLLGGMYCLCAFVLYLAWKKSLPSVTLLNIALMLKVFLVPELLLNFMMYASTSQADFIGFSFLFLLLSSGYAWLGIWKEYKHHILKRPLALILILLDLVFAIDILATATARVKELLYKPEYIPAADPVYKSETFSSRRKKGKIVRPDLSSTSKATSQPDAAVPADSAKKPDSHPADL